MAVQLSTTVRNALLDAIETASGSGAVGIQGGLSATLGDVSLLSIGRLSGVVAGPVADALDIAA